MPLVPRGGRNACYWGLICGAKGIMVFAGWRRPKLPSFDRYFESYAACAREIKGPLKLGQVFLFGERRDDLRLRVLSGPARVATAHATPIEYPSVAMLDVAHPQGRYLFLANSANEPVRVAVEGLPRVPVRVENVFEPEDQRVVAVGRFEPALEPLEVKAYRLDRADEP